ncbi:UDP-2,3-diacylglucosamine diphosphatase [Marivirga arenosa]|uniref:UDP-2,3-diacylglucosamine diphosphatase n=1 Tax=Marivirga arenosa TaxID=3059076 RepID=A0AA49JBI1_9BACT|nr:MULTISPECIES: UDP-2,3-diacylglucosamine diphosphatase [unclassified Marivirga]WKK87667.1 UDP-2,3-diacylglucosamine diphosphatase [Marivirga sp. ABR2-2]WNB18882.1 UDP-2,3-diacylglucosamine diphosphatase [Marivirga sp. BKB1-2]
MITHYKTLVISDVHLGTKGSKAKELVKFLKQCSCDRLILNGDIIDGWQLKKYGTWKRKHTRFFNRILKMIEDHKTEVIYLRGNHDDFLDQVLPFKVGNLTITRDLTIESNGKKFYVVHGDIFDSITTNLKWVAKLGDVGYTFLLWVNSLYNQYRRKKGLPYYSLSQVVKSKVKSAVSYIDDFEKQLTEIAKIKDCDGIICGHIHQAALKEINGIIYMNSGDWVESMSALAEDRDGNWSLVYYADTSSDKSINKKLQEIEIDSILNNTSEDFKLRKKTA